MATEFDLEAARRHLDAACAMVSALYRGDRRWRMCVPVQPDDPDVVICDALNVGREAVAEVERLRAVLARIGGYDLEALHAEFERLLAEDAVNAESLGHKAALWDRIVRVARERPALGIGYAVANVEREAASHVSGGLK